MDDLVREWQQALAQHQVQLEDGQQFWRLGQSSFKGHLLKLMQDVRGMMAGVKDEKQGNDDPTTATATTTSQSDPLLSLPFLHSLLVRDAQAQAAVDTEGTAVIESVETLKPVPNIAWLYWEQVPGEPQRPFYLEQCLETIQKWNTRHMQLNLVSPANLARFVPDVEYQARHKETFVGMHAAFGRLGDVRERARYFGVWALYNFGGAWLELDTIATGPLHELIERQNASGKQLTVWQRPFTREVDPSTVLVTPHHPVYKRWLEHLHKTMDAQANASLTEPVHFDPLSDVGPAVFTELLWNYAWEQREKPYAYDVRPMAEIEPIDSFHSDAWGIVPPAACAEDDTCRVDFFSHWWEQLQIEHARSPYLLRFHTSRLPLQLYVMNRRAFRQSGTCLAYMLERSLAAYKRSSELPVPSN